MRKRAFRLITLLLYLSTLGFHLNSGMSAIGSDFVLVGYWKFDEGSGIMAYDSSGYGNDGTLVNSPTWVNGISDKALRFDGVNDYVNITNSHSLNITENVKIEAWIKPDINDELMYILSKRSPSESCYTLNIGVSPDPNYSPQQNPGTHPGKIGFLWSPDGTSATEQYLVSNVVVQTNSWTNVTVVYNGSYVSMYINETLDNSTAYTGNLFGGNVDVYIGYAADSSPFHFDGVIDEVKIWRTYLPYEATIDAYCNIENANVSVSITLDGAPTGFVTPHTFAKLGTHTFTVPSTDANDHLFSKWSTGETSTTITVSLGGTYIAYYGDMPVIENHNVAVTQVTPSRTVVYRGYISEIYVRVENEGTFSETFSVTTYYNSTPLGNQTVTLAPNANAMLTFPWDTTSVPYGSYTLSANASLVPNEIDPTDNSFTDGTVPVTIPGDVNGDRIVNIVDAGLVSAHWFPGSPVGPLGYDVNIDINNDGNIDITDAAIVNSNWKKSW